MLHQHTPALHFSYAMARTMAPGYREPAQPNTFPEWLTELAEASRATSIRWDSEELRADHYENNADRWVRYYAGGYTPEAAIAEDLALQA